MITNGLKETTTYNRSARDVEFNCSRIFQPYNEDVLNAMAVLWKTKLPLKI